MQLQMSCNNVENPSSCWDGRQSQSLTGRIPVKGRAEHGCRWPWLAQRAGRTFPGGDVRQCQDGEGWIVLAQAAGVSRSGLPRRRRLHGSGKLGDVARRRLQVRLRATDGRAVVEPDGYRAEIAVRAARR